MDENEMTALVPPTPPTVVELTPPSRRPVVVTVLAWGLVVEGGPCGCCAAVVLWFLTLDPRSTLYLADRVAQTVLLLTAFSSTALAVSAIGLLRQRCWSHNTVLAMAVLQGSCLAMVAYYLSGMKPGDQPLVLGIGLVIALLVAVVPVIILTRPTVKAWFEHRR